MEKEKILVSACLRGLYCRYDGKSKMNPDLLSLKERYLMIPVCPELFGGLPIPREPSEIVGGSGYDVMEGKAKVIAKDGGDRTSDFIKGAYETLALAKNAGIKKAVFKSRSPSCGCGKIFDGSFSGKMISGDGVTASLLKQNGIEVYAEDEVDKLLK